MLDNRIWLPLLFAETGVMPPRQKWDAIAEGLASDKRRERLAEAWIGEEGANAANLLREMTQNDVRFLSCGLSASEEDTLEVKKVKMNTRSE